MSRNDYRLWLPEAVTYGSLPIGAIVGVAIGYVFPNSTALILGVIFVLGCIAIYLAKLPEVEYALGLAIACLIALLAAPTTPLALAVPGAACGYLWGCWIGDLIDVKPDRREDD